MREWFSDQTLGMWAAIACVLFLSLFAGMLVWVFRPGSREQYRDAARIPLDDTGLPRAR